MNASAFCMQLGGEGCLDDGTGKGFPLGKDDVANAWVTVDIVTGVGESGGANEVVLDLSKTNGTVFAVRYAWTGDCCSESPPSSKPCPVESCPIMGSSSALPANPFVARVMGGKCKCVAPQVCDE